MIDVNQTAWTSEELPAKPLRLYVDGKPVVIPRYHRNGMPHMYYLWLAWVEPAFREEVYKGLEFGFDGYVLWSYTMKDGPEPDKNNPNHLREAFRK